MSFPQAALVSLLAAPAVTGVSAKPFSVALHVREDAGVARTNEPLASGIPLPRGAVCDPGDLRLYGATGKAVPCQAHQLGLCWPDGSLRWVLVQFQASVAAGSDAVYTLKSAPGKRLLPPAERVTVRDTEDAVEVTTGPLRFSVSRSDFRLPNMLAVRTGSAAKPRYAPVLDHASLTLRADREAMTPEEFKATGRDPKDLWQFGLADTGTVKWGKLQQGPDGKGIDYGAMLGGPVNITVEESGPLRAVLRIERAAPKLEGEVGFVVRLCAFAAKPYVRVEYALESYEQFALVQAEGYRQAICNSKHVREFVLRLKPAAQIGGVVFGVSKEHASGGPAGHRQLEPGTDLPGGEHAPGWMTVTCGRHALSLANKWFWEVSPRALSVADTVEGGEIRLELHPADAPGPGYPLAAGRVKTYEFLLGVDTPGDRLSALARNELRAFPDPEYVTGTGATHRFVPLTDGRFSKYAGYVRKTREMAAKARQYGDVDFGDQIGWNEDERWNGYHGATHEWFVYYLASGDPELFRIAEQETWHALDVDTQHWGFLPGCMEAEYARKHDHVCAAEYQGGIKVWCFGETDYYFLTGKRRVLESLERTANFLLDCGGVANHVYVPERATSLPFLHMAYLYEALGDEAALAEAYPKAMKAGAGRFRLDSIGPQASRPYLDTMREITTYFNGVYDRKEHAPSSFLASYPAEALHRYYLLTGDPAAAEGVLKAANYLYHDLVMPTGAIMCAGGAPWSEDSPWLPWADGVDAPAALAYLVSGDKQCLDWGKASADWVLNYRGYAYSSGPWRFMGAMGFGGTLSTYLWAMREAGMTEADLVKPRTDLDLDKAIKICQDRCNEWRDRSMGNTPYSGLYCRLAAEIGRVLINQGRIDDAIAWLDPWKTAAYGVYVDQALARATALKEGTAEP
jgi:hypothetical protein